MKSMKLLISLLVFATSLNAFAGVPAKMPIEGRLTDPDGTPMLYASTQIRIQIRSPGTENCVLFSELFTGIDLSASGGRFALALNSGSGAVETAYGWTFADVFKNSGNFSNVSMACAIGTSYTPSLADSRNVQIEVYDGTTWDPFPAYALNSTAFSLQAGNADTVGNLGPANLIQSNVATGFNLSQSNITGLFADASYNELLALIAGTSTRYATASGGNLVMAPLKSLQLGRFTAGEQGTLVGGLGAGDNGKMWFNSSTQKMMVWNGAAAVEVATGASAGTVTSVGFTAPAEFTVTGAPVTTSGTIGTTWANQTANKVFASPDGVTGTPAFRTLLPTDVPNLPWSKITTGLPTTLLGYGVTDAVKNAGGTVSIQSGLNSAKPAASVAGRVWISTDTNEIYRDNGATWNLISSTAAGSVTSVTGTAPIVVGGTAASPVVSLAASGVTAGTYSKVTVDNTGRVTVGASLVGTDVTSALAFTPMNKAGDTMTGLLVLSADPSAALGASTKQYTDSSTSTAAANYLRKDGTIALTADWDADGGGVGTRLITGLAAPTANDGAVTKNYSDTKFMTKTLPAAPAVGQNGQSIRWNNTMVAWEYYTPAAGGGDFLSNGSVPMTGALNMSGNIINGNSTPSGNLTLDSTSNATKGNVLIAPSGGNVGIGTNAPSTLLDVNGAQTFRATAPPTPVAAQGKIYFDGTANKFKVSESGGAFVDLISGGGGSVTSVASNNSYLSVATGTTTPVLTLNVGTAANTVAAGDDSRITNALSRGGDTMAGLLVLSADPAANLGAATKQYVDSGITGVGSAHLRVDGTNPLSPGTAGLPAIKFSTGSGTGFFSPASDIIGFTTTGSEKMRIDNLGNVGIGTTSPGYRLHVNDGTATAIYGSSNVGNAADGAIQGNNTSFGAGVRGHSDQGSGVYASSNSSTSPAVYAVNYANGPGVAAKANAGASGFFQSLSSGNTAPTLVTKAVAGSSADLFVAQDPSGTALYTIKNNGNVGIGTSAPSAYLHVSNDAISTDTMIKVGNTASTGASASLVFQNNYTGAGRLSSYSSTYSSVPPFQSRLVLSSASGSAGIGIHADNGGDITMMTTSGANERMRIASSGNVGIGTQTPDTLLTVNGPVALRPPSTITATAYSVLSTDSSLIFAGAATCTITLPLPSAFPGRILYIKNITAFSVVSASSNISPLGSSTAAPAILPATAGKFAMLQSDGTSWIVMMSN